MFVIGTAGHVDHGKSTLVRAITGIDPDRLHEEKERGMTIDLGFAWLTLPSGREISIVDVPGHERFIKNMLAGVGGIDLALMVVATDEAVMPQTKEHLAILDLLHVKNGVIAITKSDLMDQDWLDLVTLEVEEALKETSLQGAPVIAVSAYTGDGLSELVTTIDYMLQATNPRLDIGRPRLAVDRSFVISGFGTVVTGTLADGVFTVGQDVELVLAGKHARIRGLQTHRKSEDFSLPGTRTAVNLTGVSHEEVSRGDVLTIPGWLHPTTALDVQLKLIRDAPRPLKHNSIVSLHIGTSEAMSQVRLLDQDRLLPGKSCWAQLKLQTPVAVTKGDYFVIRSSETTLGGGTVVAPYAKRHHRLHQKTLQHLAILQEGSGEQVLLEALDASGPMDIHKIAEVANISLVEAQTRIHGLIAQGKVVALTRGHIDESPTLLSALLWGKVLDRVKLALELYHQEFPLRPGAPREEIRNRLQLNSDVSSMAIRRLVDDGVLIEDGICLRLPEHKVSPTHDQSQRMSQYLDLLHSNPYSPPTTDFLEQDLLSILVSDGKVVKVNDSVVFSIEAYQYMEERVIQHLKTKGKITIAEVRDLFKTSRKYALAIMEYLDQIRITRRAGDERTLR